MEEKDRRQRSKEEKLLFLRAAEEHGILEACQRFGIPRTTYYNWKKKLEQGEGEALAGKSGGANRGKREIEGWKRKEVLAEKEENPGYGPSQACSERSESIRNQFRRRGMTMSTLTIRQILEGAGYEIKRIKEK